MDNIVREEMIEWITNPENEEILKMLKLIKDSSASSDWYRDLSERAKKSIESGLKDHQEGKTLSNEEFWLKHG